MITLSCYLRCIVTKVDSLIRYERIAVPTTRRTTRRSQGRVCFSFPRRNLNVGIRLVGINDDTPQPEHPSVDPTYGVISWRPSYSPQFLYRTVRRFEFFSPLVSILLFCFNNFFCLSFVNARLFGSHFRRVRQRTIREFRARSVLVLRRSFLATTFFAPFVVARLSSLVPSLIVRFWFLLFQIL